MSITGYQLDEAKCNGCGLCTRACPPGIIHLDGTGKARIEDVGELGWYGCWQCQHCLAVCPQGAISIFGRAPGDSPAPPSAEEAFPLAEALVRGRRSCRDFRDENLDPALIEELLDILATAPTGGNKQMVEYTLIDDKDQVRALRDAMYRELESQAARGVYPATFDAASYQRMKAWQREPGDLIFRTSPHLLIPHAPGRIGCTVQDVNIAAAYFELLCAARGLGAILMTFPLRVLDNMPEVRALLGVPEDHYMSMFVGFGHPAFRYARGVQRGGSGRVHRPRFI